MTTGDQKTFSQIMKQTSKLVESKMIFSVEPSFSLIREILMVKFSTFGIDVEKLKNVITSYNGRIIDTSGGCFVAEVTDTPEVIDDFLEAVEPYKLVEMCRSGAIAMERGEVSYEF